MTQASCGNDGPWKAWKTKIRFSTLSTALGNRFAIPTFHTGNGEADGKVENQMQVSHFPTATTSLVLREKHPGRGRASPSARRRALHAA